MKYQPRRCSKRWLDSDCPRGVLAIMDHPKEVDRYTVFYAELYAGDYRDGWLTYLSSDENGWHSHGEMEAYKVASYRYSQKHRYIRWTDLPDVVRDVVRKDLNHD